VSGLAVKNDGNNVDLDREARLLSENALRFSMASVEQARVHLTFPKDSVFLEAQQPAKASVLDGERRRGVKVGGQ
jgi:hypothetical protein